MTENMAGTSCAPQGRIVITSERYQTGTATRTSTWTTCAQHCRSCPGKACPQRRMRRWKFSRRTTAMALLPRPPRIQRPEAEEVLLGLRAVVGAEHRVRTRDLRLGKVTLLLPFATPLVLPVSPSFRCRALRRLCSLVQCRLQNVSKTAAEWGGLARNPADIGLPRKLLHPRANRRIGVRRRPVSNF